MARESSTLKRILWGILVCVCPANSFGQWRNLSDLSERLYCITELQTEEGVLFAGGDHIWRSNDNGKNWNQIAYLGDIIFQIHFGSVSEDTAWAASISGCWRSIDRGKTWSKVIDYHINSVYLHKYSKRLFASSGIPVKPSLYSTDFGDSWYETGFIEPSDPNIYPYMAGYAFLNDLEGVVTPNLNVNYFTTDGGISWKLGGLKYVACWQPVAHIPTHSFVAAEQRTGKIQHSLDGGLTWSESKAFDQLLSGDLHADSCGRLYLQSSQQGFFRSDDGGYDWSPLGGPSCLPYGRFWLSGKKLLAVDTFTATEPRRAGVWQYVGSPLQLAIPTKFEFDRCSDTSFSIDYRFEDFCVGAYPELKTASISGSPNFEITLDGTAREIRTPQSIAVTYHPQSSKRDTTYLKLTYWTGNETFDTTITFIGSGSNPQQVSLGLSASQSSVQNNEVVIVRIKPDRAVSAAKLSELKFNIEYLDDLFRLKDAISPVGALIGSAQRIGNKLVIPVTLSGTDISLDPSTPLVEVHLAARLSDSVRTSVDLTDIKLNDGDPDYASCRLTASSTSATVGIDLNCGDRIIQRVIRGEKAIAIKSINPNPAQKSVVIEYESKLSDAVRVEVYNVSGVLMHEEVVSQSSANKSLQLDTSSWPSGAYTIVLKSGESEARGTVIKK